MPQLMVLEPFSHRFNGEQLHPVAYASSALNPHEVNYGITELEILGAVWAMSHYTTSFMGTA